MYVARMVRRLQERCERVWRPHVRCERVRHLQVRWKGPKVVDITDNAGLSSAMGGKPQRIVTAVSSNGSFMSHGWEGA